MLSNNVHKYSKTTIFLAIILVFALLIVFTKNSCNLSQQYEFAVASIQLSNPVADDLPVTVPPTIEKKDDLPTVPPALQKKRFLPIPTDEVVDQGTDEMFEGQTILTYYRKLAAQVGNFGAQSSGGNIQLLSAFSYKDHYHAVIAVPRRIGASIWCRYLDKDGKEIGDALESVVYPYYVVYCSRRDGTVKLGITDKKDGVISDINSMKLLKRKYKEYQQNVSYCLAPIYGTEPKWLHTIELIEHYKLQGVNHFFIYIRTISDYDRKAIDSYVKTGEVEIIEVPNTNNDVIAQQLMAVEDCLLRSRSYSKWSIFSDIDERLIMTDDRMTIDGFLRNVTDESIGSIAFPQRWIMKREQMPEKYESDEQIMTKMATRAWHETSSAAMKGHPICREQPSCWAKDIVNNEKAIRMLVHEVTDFYPGYREWFLDSSIGYIRHYRDVKMQNWESNNMKQLLQFGPFSNTSYPAVLGSKLTRNVLDRVHMVYGK